MYFPSLLVSWKRWVMEWHKIFPYIIGTHHGNCASWKAIIQLKGSSECSIQILDRIVHFLTKSSRDGPGLPWCAIRKLTIIFCICSTKFRTHPQTGPDLRDGQLQFNCGSCPHWQPHTNYNNVYRRFKTPPCRFSRAAQLNCREQRLQVPEVKFKVIKYSVITWASKNLCGCSENYSNHKRALLRAFLWSTSNHKQGLFGQNTLYRPYKTSVSLTQPVEAALLHSRVDVTIYFIWNH